MKKFLSLVLVVMMVAAIFALSASAMVGDGYHNYGKIANVDRKTIRLDAVKEDVYNKATPIPIKYPATNAAGEPNYAERDNKEDPVASGTAYFVYDGTYIWAYVEVIDPTLATAADTPLTSKYTEDTVEIMVDWENAGVNIDDVAPSQSRISHEGYISARLGQNGKTMQGTAEQGSTNPVNWLNGTAKQTFNADGTLKGYDCEFRINIPEDKEIGKYISIGLMINDYDSNGRGRIIVSSDPVTGFSEWQVNKLGYIQFDYAPYTADTTIIYVVVAMVAALGLGAVTLISLRRRAK